MIDPLVQKRLSALLFADHDLACYAVLDGAAIETLTEQLERWQPEHYCLYRGSLSPALIRAAPYLVRVKPKDRFSQWLVEQGWGLNWGIYVHSAARLRQLARHLRAIHLTRDQQGRRMVFRFYDPRVLNSYLPLFADQQRETFFGPITQFIAETAEPPHEPQAHTNPNGNTDNQPCVGP